MKGKLKALGISVVLLLIYFGFQIFTGFLFALFSVVSIAAGYAAGGSVPDIDDFTARLTESINGSSAGILFVSAALSLMVYILIYSDRRPDFVGLWKFRRFRPKQIALLIVFSVSFSVVIEFLLSMLSSIEVFHTLFEKYGKLMKLISGPEFFVVLFFVGILIPIFEEILFRGLIFGELNKVMRVRYAVLLQALIFGMAHLNIIQGVYAFLLGLLLGYIYRKSGILLYPIIIHVAFNTFSVIMSALSTEAFMERWQIAVIVAGFILFFASGVMLRKSFKKMNGGNHHECNSGADDTQLDQGISAGSD
ncbi:MAG: CPBP family intramembrane metalloprotease [Clostridiales bacterium]|nr:CPBP family intramembrane metalloprotease [Clostridiales bacterium]